jgi:cytochrome c oxidase assembly factor CtaG
MVSPIFGASWFGKFASIVVHPVSAWIEMNTAFLVWHVPAVFDLALRSENWHTVEHLCFFLTSLTFRWIVIQPWPSHAVWSRWMAILYLISAGLVNTILSAFLTFSGRVLYPTYANAPRVCNLTALSDQVAAAAGTWFFGSLVFLIAAMWVAHVLLSRADHLTKWTSLRMTARYHTQFRTEVSLIGQLGTNTSSLRRSHRAKLLRFDETSCRDGIGQNPF